MSQDSPPPTEAQLLQALLASRDIACPVCAYNLRSNESKNCPECGAALDLRVGSMDLKLGPWLTSLFGLALPLGFVSIYALVGIAFSLMYAFSGGGPGILGLLAAMAVPTLVCAGYAFLLWRLVRRRRKFWAKPRRAQWRSALLYAVLGPGALLIPLLLLLFAFGAF
ncbi:MAG: hypothetical protein ACYTBR_01040 [Planctomycetota bacterium]|jgi:hypothetical protein